MPTKLALTATWPQKLICRSSADGSPRFVGRPPRVERPLRPMRGAVGVPARKRVSGKKPAGITCRRCLDKKAAAQTARDHRRVAQGRCVRCNVNLINVNFRECASCRSRANRWWAKRNGRPLPEILPARTQLRPRTLRRPAGMKPEQLRATALERAAGMNADRPLPGRPERPCSACGQRFAPTLRRRLLCGSCFHRGDAGPDAA